jgi:hypothetical protein
MRVRDAATSRPPIAVTSAPAQNASPAPVKHHGAHRVVGHEAAERVEQCLAHLERERVFSAPDC